MVSNDNVTAPHVDARRLNDVLMWLHARSYDVCNGFHCANDIGQMCRCAWLIRIAATVTDPHGQDYEGMWDVYVNETERAHG